MKKQKEAFAWGVKNVHFIWHGTNADPEVSYRRHVVNYYTVEDTMWEEFKGDNQIVGNESEDEITEKFHKYCQDHEYMVKELIMSI